MLLPEVSNEITNKISKDQFKRISSVLLMNKPTSVTSHDIVDDVRKVLRTRKVGHAGALDPFASGLLIVLVGKYTKYTEAFINLEKSYRAEVILGVKTDTQDPEGALLASEDMEDDLVESLKDPGYVAEKLRERFEPSYEQLVPIYSSVKVNGYKLRKIARSATEITQLDDNVVEFIVNGESIKIELPKRKVSISDIKILSVKEIDEVNLDSQKEKVKGKFFSIELEVTVSKGTYIRQFAEDLGEIFGHSAYLKSLERLTVSGFSLESCLSVSELYEKSVELGILNTPISELNLKAV